MRKRLSTLLAFVGVLFMSATSVAWDEPVAPSTPVFEAAWTEPTTGNSYYIYNVGAAQFLGTGLDWGTRTCTTTDSVVTVNQAEVTVALNVNYIVPFAVEAADVDGFYCLRTMNTSKGAAAYVSSWGTDSWSDFGISDDTKWELAALADGKYAIKVMKDQTRCLGVNEVGTTTSYAWIMDFVEDNAKSEWRFTEATDATADAMKDFFKNAGSDYQKAMEVYHARKALYDLLVMAEGLGVDCTAAGGVFTSDASTVAELEAARETLSPAVLKAGIAASSEPNPFDVTSFVMKNADFSAQCENGRLPEGWEITVTGTNIGQQNRTDVNPDDASLFLSNFIECWVSTPATLGDGYIGQWVSGLPQGRYRMTMEAAACNQSSGFDPTSITGVYLFAGTEEYKLHGEESVAGAPYEIRHYEWDFDFNADRLLLGLLVKGTNANWISADNFHLYAIGAMQEDPVKTSLRNAINEAELLAEKMGENNIEDTYGINCGKTESDAFFDALDQAKALLNSGSADEMQEAINALSEATDAVKESAALYVEYQAVYAHAEKTVATLQAISQWPDLQSQINSWIDELIDAFEAGSLTADGLAEAQGKVDEIVAAFIGDGSAIQPGDDLTVLIKNADFSEGQYGRSDAATFEGDETSIPGWTVVSGNITELSGEYHNIEAYGQTFDFQQTIKNLPAGSYRVTVQGYVRVDGGENNMVLYAGLSEKQFMNITEEYSEIALLADEFGETPGWPYDTPRPDGLGYQPNSMQGADIYFNTVNPATGNPFYLNDVTIAHSGGDLTIGLRSSGPSLWILWDNFTLTFLSSEAIAPILEDIEAAYNQLEELMNNGFTTSESIDAAAELQSRVNKMQSITETSEAMALLNDIKALMETIKAERAMSQELIDAFELYSLKVSEAGITDQNYLDIIEEVDGLISSEDFQSMAEMEHYMNRLIDGFAQALVAQTEAGQDITIVINNADFELLNSSFWSLLPIEEGGRIGDNQGYQSNATYTTDQGGQIEHFIEAWRSDSQPLHDGDVCQTIGVLPEGYYSLAMDGFALNQAAVPEEGVQGVDLFAQNGSLSVTTSICTQTNDWGSAARHFSLDFHSDGINRTTIGVRIAGTNANWFLADNFTLVYAGTEAPDGVDSIRETATQASVFGIDGRRRTALHRGINIVRAADGSVKKVLLK